MTLAQLKATDCRSFGGNNCVLHGCMFYCVLYEAKKNALAKEKGITRTELDTILKTTGNSFEKLL